MKANSDPAMLSEIRDAVQRNAAEEGEACVVTSVVGLANIIADDGDEYWSLILDLDRPAVDNANDLVLLGRVGERLWRKYLDDGLDGDGEG